jgi:hypothetical protein
VPGHTVNDALYRRPAEDDPLTSVVLGYPGALSGIVRSQIEWAEALGPTFAFVWIGNNGVLAYATSGGTEPITPIDDFDRDYQELLDRLEATGADLIIANVPDVTSIAFFLTAEEVAAQAGQPLSEIGPILGIDSGDLVTIEALPLVKQILAGQMPPPLPDQAVLDAQEITISRQSVNDVNRIICRLCDNGVKSTSGQNNPEFCRDSDQRGGERLSFFISLSIEGWISTSRGHRRIKEIP